MKMFDIFVYLTIFNFMLMVLVVVPSFSETSIQPAEVGGAEIYDDWEDFGAQAGVKPSTIDVLWLSFVGLLKAIPMLARAFLNATVMLPWFLSSALQIPKSNPIIIMFTSLVWINYGIGLLQLWMKTSIKHME